VVVRAAAAPWALAETALVPVDTLARARPMLVLRTPVGTIAAGSTTAVGSTVLRQAAAGSTALRQAAAAPQGEVVRARAAASVQAAQQAEAARAPARLVAGLGAEAARARVEAVPEVMPPAVPPAETVLMVAPKAD